MTKIADVRAKTADELNTMLLDLRKEQFNPRFQRATASPFRWTTSQDLRLEIGRHSSMETVSPSRHRLVSSCAAYFLERRMNFL